MQRFSIEQVIELLTVFGVSLPSPLTAEAFTQAKVAAKKQYKRLALKHHPDVGGDEETFKRLNAAWELLHDIQVAQPQRVTVIHMSWGYYPDTTTTTGGVW